ncbi:hypothetical protein GJA_2062 [Janthinobacterium agaricidamnosum NBRC 102515 = DSM 9628]|uniref:Uncharacterized protein n=1 Tax=Janthinobacterium agaricidamnosum NBRC 102515 = DSM 9628 TaxID=1349767 RepID=W0V603_9BURK|nr:hypothetical protein GJA_2062 [Janthinobacterium agaricidamnosum NBRC 102515 = DSM 9628]
MSVAAPSKKARPFSRIVHQKCAPAASFDQQSGHQKSRRKKSPLRERAESISLEEIEETDAS